MTTTDEPRTTKDPAPPQRPTGGLEMDLFEAQAGVIAGQHALAERNRLLSLMREGYTLRHLTGILNAAAEEFGGTPITEDAVQKAVRLRRKSRGR